MRYLPVALVSLLGLAACASLRPPDYRPPGLVAAALSDAGDNRSELEAALAHYAAEGDPEKLAACEFLIANMEGQGFARIQLVSDDGTVVPYEALDHPSYPEALTALEALEAEHGNLEFHGTEFVRDLDVITAAFLIADIDRAFVAWRANPWSRGIDFATFQESILPYRGSNEPLEAWRGPVTERLAGVTGELADEADVKTAAARVNREVGRWVGFDSIFYVHPTDQGYGEMLARGKGRCEDITNMNTYAMRAAALASAADYTPYWADRDNNHAWPVVLDDQGVGRTSLSHRAAKVYRKTFALQRDGLAFRLGAGEAAPPWLDRKHFRDVTRQYLETSDFEVSLDVPPPSTSQHAYLCVFNAGEWHAIAWAPLDREAQCASFEAMGRDIVYLPAYFTDGALVPAGSPFFLHADGSREAFDASAKAIPVDLLGTGPGQLELAADGRYDLYLWREGDWQHLGRQSAGGGPTSAAMLPGDGLYWLVQEGSRRLERPFAVKAGNQVWM